MTADLWTAASTDHDQAAFARRVAEVRVRLADAWPFLAQATSRPEFDARLLVLGDRLADLADDDEAVLAEVTSRLDEDWQTLHQARLAEAQERALEAALTARVATQTSAEPPETDSKEAQQHTAAEMQWTIKDPQGHTVFGPTSYSEAAQKYDEEYKAQPFYSMHNTATQQTTARSYPEATPHTAADVPEELKESDADEQDCPACDGNGTVPDGEGGIKDCEVCDGTGTTSDTSSKESRRSTSTGTSTKQAAERFSPGDQVEVVEADYDPEANNGAGRSFEVGETYRVSDTYTHTDGQTYVIVPGGWLEVEKVRKASGRKLAWSAQDLRAIVDGRQAQTIDGSLVDPTTAQVLLQIHDAVSADKQQRLTSLPIQSAVDIAWKLTGGKDHQGSKEAFSWPWGGGGATTMDRIEFQPGPGGESHAMSFDRDDNIATYAYIVETTVGDDGSWHQTANLPDGGKMLVDNGTGGKEGAVAAIEREQRRLEEEGWERIARQRLSRHALRKGAQDDDLGRVRITEDYRHPDGYLFWKGSTFNVMGDWGDEYEVKTAGDYVNIPASIAERIATLRKGAPFAGYDDFDSCVSANSDKDDPSAYCGKIKHQVEDDKTGSKTAAAITLSAKDAARFAAEMAAWRRLAQDLSGLSASELANRLDDVMTQMSAASGGQLADLEKQVAAIEAEQNRRWEDHGSFARNSKAANKADRMIQSLFDEGYSLADITHAFGLDRPGPTNRNPGWDNPDVELLDLRGAVRRQAGMLEHIRSRDPDGKPTMPTEADYERFERWIVDTYGEDALRTYRGWGRGEDAAYAPWAEDDIPGAGFHAHRKVAWRREDSGEGFTWSDRDYGPNGTSGEALVSPETEVYREGNTSTERVTGYRWEVYDYDQPGRGPHYQGVAQSIEEAERAADEAMAGGQMSMFGAKTAQQVDWSTDDGGDSFYTQRGNLVAYVYELYDPGQDERAWVWEVRDHKLGPSGTVVAEHPLNTPGLSESEAKAAAAEALNQHAPIDDPMADQLSLFGRRQQRQERESRRRTARSQAARKRGASTKMQCLECGNTFRKNIGPNTVEVRCPRCGGYDTEPADILASRRKHGGFEVQDEQGNTVAGPFETIEEAEAYVAEAEQEQQQEEVPPDQPPPDEDDGNGDDKPDFLKGGSQPGDNPFVAGGRTAQQVRDAYDQHFVQDADGLLFGGPGGPMVVGWDEGQRMIQEGVGDPQPARQLLPVTWNKAVYMGEGDLTPGVPRGWRALPKNAARTAQYGPDDNPYGGANPYSQPPGPPPLPPVEVDRRNEVTPQTTRPRTEPDQGVEREVPQEPPRSRERGETPSQPLPPAPASQRAARSYEDVEETILATNPGMPRGQAARLARALIARYPEVVVE